MVDNEIVENSNYDLEVEKELKHFNWGAFFLNWIWGIGNKSYLPFLVFIPFGIIPILGPIINLCLVIWIGMKGNEWAWKNKHWNSLEHFRRVQRSWTKWALIIQGIFMVVGIVSVVLFLNLHPALLSIEDISKCTSMETYITKAVNNVPLDSSTYYKDIAKQFKDTSFEFISVEAEGNQIDILAPKYHEPSIEVTVQKAYDCSFDKLNCSMTVKMASDNGICRYYYDNTGKVVMSNKTKKFIDKINENKVLKNLEGKL